MTRELFVYYRVRPADCDAAYAAVDRLQTGLVAEFAGLQARVLRRPFVADAPDALQTWMEVYATAPRGGSAGIDPTMQAAIEARAALLAPLIAGGRHVEVFETIEPAQP